MRSKKILFVVSLLYYLVSSCQQKFDLQEVNQLNHQEILKRQVAGAWDLSATTFLSRDLIPVQEVHLDSIRNNLVSVAFYTAKDDPKTVVYAIMQDWLLEENIRRALSINYDSSLIVLGQAQNVIDCSQLVEEIDLNYNLYPGTVYAGDTVTYESQFSITEKRLADLLTHCTYDQIAALPWESRKRLWLEYQHKSAELRASFYYPLIDSLFKTEVFPAEFRALSQDRILMEANFPQIYGSQLMNGELWPIRDTTNLDSIRVSLGMLPLEEYLEMF